MIQSKKASNGMCNCTEPIGYYSQTDNYYSNQTDETNGCKKSLTKNFDKTNTEVFCVTEGDKEITEISQNRDIYPGFTYNHDYSKNKFRNNSLKVKTKQRGKMNEKTERNMNEKSNDRKMPKKLNLEGKYWCEPINGQNIYPSDSNFTKNEENKKEIDFTQTTPLSGHKLVSCEDGLSPYLKCLKYISMNTISPLIDAIPNNKNLEEENPSVFKSKISDIIRDSQVWPPVWTCFGKGCIVECIKGGLRGAPLSLNDPVTIDYDPGLKEFQMYWNSHKQFFILDKEIINGSKAKLTIIPSREYDAKANQLQVKCPINHPFYVIEKGWVQVESRNVYFKSLSKFDVIGHVEDLTFFSFSSPEPCFKDNGQNINKNSENKLNSPHLVPRKPIQYEEYTSRDVNTFAEFPYKSPNLFYNPNDFAQAHNYNFLNQGMTYNYPERFENFHHTNRQNNQFNNQPISKMDFNYTNPLCPPPYQENHSNTSRPSNKSLNPPPDEDESKKRPMNGFMLFAKTMRLQLINQNPGKDNRVISQILGKKWKMLPEHEKKQFKEEARIKSLQRLRLNPLCWKRKNPPKRINKKSEVSNSNIIYHKNDREFDGSSQTQKMYNDNKSSPMEDGRNSLS